MLKNLGSEACWICHGEGGFDEIVPTGITWIAELKNGGIAEFELTPEAVGLKRWAAADLKGGEAAHNAEALRDVLKGEAIRLPRCRRDDGGCGTPGRRQGEDHQGRRANGSRPRSTMAQR